MTIKELLDEYKEKKTKLDITLSTIGAWEEAIEHPENLVYLVRTTAGKELGMPRVFSTSSPVEMEVINKEKDQERAVKLVREWIREEEFKVFPLRIEIQRIELALNSLTETERYIIECKHFEKMRWRDIEINYNDKFSKQNDYITDSGLRKKYEEIKRKLYNILKPFYINLSEK